MADLRRSIPVFATLVLVTGLGAPASAQNGLVCTASAPTVTSTPPQPVLRQEGFTEMTADIVLTCVGAPGASPTPTGTVIPQADVTVSLSAPVTSRILPGGTSSSPFTEALLLVDDPSPGTPYPALGNQDPCLSPLNPIACQVVGDGGQTFNQTGKFNVFQGIGGGPGSSSITFLGVPVDPPGPTLTSRTYRITNLRINATNVGADNFTPVFSFVSASPSSSIQINNSQNEVGFATYGLTTGTSVTNTLFEQCVSSSMTQVGTVTFTENFATAFKVAGLTGQNVPGTVYYTESGLEIAVTGTAGPADTGTKLQLAISGIPSGVTIWVDDWAQSTGAVGCTSPTSNAGCTTLSDATLVAGTMYVPPADPGTNTPQQALPGTSATFVWAVTNTNSEAIDSISFNIYAAVSAGAGTGTVTALGGFSPQQLSATNPMTGPIPEFSATVNVPASANLFTVSPCATVSGKVKLSGRPFSGVTMTLSGAQRGSTTTNASGNYSFTVPAGASYTVTPSPAGYIFTPPSSSFTLSGNLTANFTAFEIQTITFGPLSNEPLGTSPFPVSATASSGLTVHFTSLTPAVCTVSDNTVTLIAVGTCTIRATQPGNADWAAATPVNESFQVTRESQTITFLPLPNEPYGTPPFTVGATASSGLTVRFISATPSVCTMSGVTVTLFAVGTCTIHAIQTGNASYLPATPVNQSFQVTKGSQTITFLPLPNLPLGTPPFTVGATASSGLTVRFISATPSVCTMSGVTVTLVAVGTCTIHAIQTGNIDWDPATPVNQSFQVTRESQTITFLPLSNQPFGAAAFTVSATASSGLTVSFASSTPLVCTLSGNTVTLVSGGTCTIRATQGGNATYLPAAPVDQSFQVTPGFALTGSMTTGRESHTATLLSNGNVLVAGGDNGNLVTLSSAELYNPSTATFRATGNMTTAREDDTATLLNNGEVLIAGGFTYGSCCASYSSAELYNPTTGTFTATGSMIYPRDEHMATLLTNGKILITGGWDPNDNPLAPAEIYNPAAGKFTAAGNMTTARLDHTATLLPNGKVLIAGGFNSSLTIVASAELYDPAAGTFTATGNMTAARAQHTATVLTNGKVLIAGGDNNGSVLSSAELYDPATGTFTATGSMITACSVQTATLLGNGEVLIAGGANPNGAPLSTAELYDPAAATFTATGSMTTIRVVDTATLLNNGEVLITGGQGPLGVALSSAELFSY